MICKIGGVNKAITTDMRCGFCIGKPERFTFNVCQVVESTHPRHIDCDDEFKISKEDKNHFYKETFKSL